MQTLSSEPLEFPMRHKHGNRLTPAGQFDFDTSFGLVDDPGQLGTGLGNGIPLGHVTNVHLDVHRNKQAVLAEIDLRWHDLRHEAACRWLPKGLDRQSFTGTRSLTH